MSKMKRIEQIARKMNIVDAAAVALREKKIRRAVEAAKDKTEEIKIEAEAEAAKILANFGENTESQESMTRAMQKYADCKCKVENAEATLKYLEEFEAALDEEVEVEDKKSKKDED